MSDPFDLQRAGHDVDPDAIGHQIGADRADLDVAHGDPEEVRRLVAQLLAAGLATSKDFYPTILSTFKAAVPLIRFLNEGVGGG